MRLVYERGGERIAFPLDEGETFIGRKEYCEIYFPDASLSKRHARLLREGRALWVFDAGSRNGTLVNDEVVEEARLRTGDVLQCGKLRFRVEGVPAGSEDGEDYRFVEESRGSAARTHTSSRPGVPVGSTARSGPPLPTARAVASTDARPSMLDVLPELPPSTERAGAPLDGEPPPARMRLVEGGEEQVWDLTGDTLTIGSKPENAICLKGEGVSRYHAELAHEEGGWVLKDLGARNGLFVRGERIDIYELKDGDEVQIGTCRLRFELPRVTPADAAREALRAIASDPVGALKRDPRARISLAALIAAMALVAMGLKSSGGGPAQGGGGPVAGHGPWLQDGATLLVSGDYAQARAVFRKAKANLGPQEQTTPRVLESVAGLWLNLERGPLTFRWDKAGELLQASARLEGLPSNLTAWLKTQATFVDRNQAAFQTITDVEALGTDATAKAADKQFRLAIDLFAKAISRAREVPPDTLLHARAQELIDALHRNAYQALLAEVHDRMRAGNPRWDDCLALIQQTFEFASTPDHQNELRRLAEDCERNRRDEVAYMRGVDIVHNHQVNRYQEAIQYFERVAPQSRVYPDAQAYVKWIDADRKVRQAKRAYDLGDWRRARDLLTLALQHDVLGPEARETVRTRHQSWSRVVQAYSDGMRAYDKNDIRTAKAELERVLQFEPNRANRFHLRARQQLQHILDIEAADLKKKVKRGFEALERSDWAKAFEWFGEVEKDPNHSARDLEAIRQAVVQASAKHRLVTAAERDVMHDRTDRFLELRDVCKLLVKWLPRDHPEWPRVKKLYDSVIERLKNLQNWSKVR